MKLRPRKPLLPRLKSRKTRATNKTRTFLIKRNKTIRLQLRRFTLAHGKHPQRTRAFSAIFKLRAQKGYVAKLLRLRKLERTRAAFKSVRAITVSRRVAYKFAALTKFRSNPRIARRRLGAVLFLARRHAALRDRARARKTHSFPPALRAPLTWRARKTLRLSLGRRADYKSAILSLRARLRRIRRRSLDVGQRAYHSRIYLLTNGRARQATWKARSVFYKRAWSRLLRASSTKTQYRLTRRSTSRYTRRPPASTRGGALAAWLGAAEARRQPRRVPARGLRAVPTTHRAKKLAPCRPKFFCPSHTVAFQVTKLIAAAEVAKAQKHAELRRAELKLDLPPLVKIITRRQRLALARRARLKKQLSKRQQRRLRLVPPRVVVKKEALGLDVRISVKRKAAASPSRIPVSMLGQAERAARVRRLLAQPLLPGATKVTPATYHPRHRLPSLIAALKRYAAVLLTRKSLRATAWLLANVCETITELEHALHQNRGAALNVPTWVVYRSTPREIKDLILPTPGRRKSIPAWRATRQGIKLQGAYEAFLRRSTTKRYKWYNKFLGKHEKPVYAFADERSHAIALAVVKSRADLKKTYPTQPYLTAALPSIVVPQLVNKKGPSYLTVEESDARALLMVEVGDASKRVSAKPTQKRLLVTGDTPQKRRVATRLRVGSLYLRRARRAGRIVARRKAWRFCPASIRRKNRLLRLRRRSNRARTIRLRLRTRRIRIYRRGSLLSAQRRSTRRKAKRVKGLRRRIRVRQKLSRASKKRLILHRRHFRKYYYPRRYRRVSNASAARRNALRRARYNRQQRKGVKRRAHKLSTGRRAVWRRLSRRAPLKPWQKRRASEIRKAKAARLKSGAYQRRRKSKLRARHKRRAKFPRTVRRTSRLKRKAKLVRATAKKMKALQKMLRGVPRNTPFRSTAGPRVFTLLSALHAVAAFARPNPQAADAKSQTLLALQPTSASFISRTTLNTRARYLAHRQLSKHLAARRAGVHNLLRGFAGLSRRGRKLRPYRDVRSPEIKRRLVALTAGPVWSRKADSFVVRRSAARLLPLKDRLRQLHNWKLQFKRSLERRLPQPARFRYRPAAVYKRRHRSRPLRKAYNAPFGQKKTKRGRSINAKRRGRIARLRLAQFKATLRRPVFVKTWRRSETRHNYRRRQAQEKQKWNAEQKKAPQQWLNLRLRYTLLAYRRALLKSRQKARQLLLFQRAQQLKLFLQPVLRPGKKARILSLIKRRSARLRLYTLKLLRAGRRSHRGVALLRQRRKAKSPVYFARKWWPKTQHRGRRAILRAPRGQYKFERYSVFRAIRQERRKKPAVGLAPKKTLFVSSGPVTPLADNKALVYILARPAADSIGFTREGSAETREGLWQVIFNHEPARERKNSLGKTPPARGTRQAKKTIFRRAGSALTSMQRTAAKLKLGRLLTLKKLLRTNQFSRLEQLGRVNDLGEHSPLGSLVHVAALGLLTKDIKQTLLLKLTAGIRVAARSCVDSSGRGLLRQHAVVTRVKQRVLFARNGRTSAAKTTGLRLNMRRPISRKRYVRKLFTALRHIHNLQSATKVPPTNTALILAGAKHPARKYNKLRKLLVEQGFNSFSGQVLSETARLKLEKSYSKLTKTYKAVLRAGRRSPELQKKIQEVAEELQQSENTEAAIDGLYQQVTAQQAYSAVSTYQTLCSRKRRSTRRRSARRGNAKRNATKRNHRRPATYGRSPALPKATGLAATQPRAPLTKLSLPLSKISSSYTGAPRTVSTQQLWTDRLGEWSPVDYTKSGAPTLRKSFSTPLPWAQKVIFPGADAKGIDHDLTSMFDGTVAARAAVILAAKLRKPLLRTVRTRNKAKAIYFPSALPDGKFWDTEQPTALPTRASRPLLSGVKIGRTKKRRAFLLMRSAYNTLESLEAYEDAKAVNPKAQAKNPTEVTKKTSIPVKAAKKKQADTQAERAAAAERNKRKPKSEYNRELKVTVFDGNVFANINKFSAFPKDQRNTKEAYGFLVRALKSVESTSERKDISDHQQSAQRQAVIRLLESVGSGISEKTGEPFTWKELTQRLPVVKPVRSAAPKTSAPKITAIAEVHSALNDKYRDLLRKVSALPEDERACREPINWLRQVINGTWTAIDASKIIPVTASPLYGGLVHAVNLFTGATGVTVNLSNREATKKSVDAFKSYTKNKKKS